MPDQTDIATRITSIEARLQELKSIGTPGNFTAGQIAYGGANGKLVSDANLKWDSINKKLTGNGGNTIGYTSLQTIDVATNNTSVVAGEQAAYHYELLVNPGATQLTAGRYNMLLLTRFDGSGGSSSAGAIYGLRVDHRYNQTAGTASGVMIGLDIIPRHSNAGTLSNIYGARILPIMSSTGGITNYIGFLVETPSITGAGGIANAYGFRVSNQTIAGVTQAYGIYQAGANDANVFAGLTTLGSTSLPNTRLDIRGTVNNYGLGPHIDFTTSVDAHIVLQILPYNHDNINLTFDGHWDGSNWVSGDAGSSFQIRKSGDELAFFRATPVAAGSTITTWNLGFSLQNDSFVNFAPGANKVRQTANFYSLANNGIAAFPANNFGFALLQNGGGAAMYIINGSNHGTQEVFDPAGIYTPTAGSATSINVYWSAGNNRYEIQNTRGSTQNIRVWFFDAA